MNLIKKHLLELLISKQKIIRYILYIFLFFLVVLFLINLYIILGSKDKIINLSKLNNNYNIWLVLWASVKSNWIPSDILKDRLYTAYLAYKNKKITKIIVSWDNSKKNYNEPQAMKRYLVSIWVKSKDIYLDYAWFDTYDSLYRVKYIFWVKKLVVFTQKYHLFRTIYIWDWLWIDILWVISDRHKYINILKFKIREFFSRIKAFLDVDILKSNPRFLWKKIEIK